MGKRVYDGPMRDIYVMIVHPNAPLPRHYKTQLKRIFVVSGGMTVTLDGKEPVVLDTGDAYEIKANVQHVCKGGIHESLIVCTYEPPFMDRP